MMLQPKTHKILRFKQHLQYIYNHLPPKILVRLEPRIYGVKICLSNQLFNYNTRFKIATI